MVNGSRIARLSSEGVLVWGLLTGPVVRVEGEVRCDVSLLLAPKAQTLLDTLGAVGSRHSVEMCGGGGAGGRGVQVRGIGG